MDPFSITTDARKYAWLWAEHNHTPGGTVTVGTATFIVFDVSGATVISSASATLDDNSTAKVYIGGLVDGSSLTADEWYEGVFTVSISGENYKPRIPIFCEETKL
jgi:hypothetical protein